MSDSSRYCPLCDARTDARTCPVHQVPTVDAAALSATDTLAAGTVLLTRYVIDKPLGRGGMGTVYRAHQSPFGRAVAIKTMRPELARSPSHLRRFYLEADALMRLSHPNVLKVFDFGVDETLGVAALVMELVEGAPLDLPAQGLPEEEGARLLWPVASALAAAHASGVVHRDLKPENILVSRLADGERVVKVVDFGLARVTDDVLRAAGPTSAGQIVGTPAYISPEQVAQGETDHRVDLYALGCLLFQALTGAPPFRGDALEVLSAHLGAPVPPLPSTVSPEMSALVLGLLAKRPTDRPSDAAEVARRLKRLALDGPRAHEPKPTSPTDLAPRRPWRIAATLAVMGVGAVVGVVAMSSPREASSVAAPSLEPSTSAMAPLPKVATTPAPIATTQDAVSATETSPATERCDPTRDDTCSAPTEEPDVTEPETASEVPIRSDKPRPTRPSKPRSDGPGGDMEWWGPRNSPR